MLGIDYDFVGCDDARGTLYSHPSVALTAAHVVSI